MIADFQEFDELETADLEESVLNNTAKCKLRVARAKKDLQEAAKFLPENIELKTMIEAIDILEERIELQMLQGWAKSLNDDQLAYLSDYGYYNDVIRGYVIATFNQMTTQGLTPEERERNELARNLIKFDDKDKAVKAFLDVLKDTMGYVVTAQAKEIDQEFTEQFNDK